MGDSKKQRIGGMLERAHNARLVERQGVTVDVAGQIGATRINVDWRPKERVKNEKGKLDNQPVITVRPVDISETGERISRLLDHPDAQ